MIRIFTIEEDQFEPFRPDSLPVEYRKVSLRQSDHSKTLIIAPHYCETYISYQLLSLAVHCRRNQIKLISVGTMNQLPFFSMFSDEVWLETSKLESLFTAESSFGATSNHFPQIPGFKDIYNEEFEEKTQAANISTEDIIREFSEPTVYLRKSTFETFETLNLPENAIACEIKQHFYPSLYEMLNRSGTLIGLDKSWQKGMVKRVGDHFMGIQLLASLLKGWRFIAAGGAVNLLNVLPVHPLLFLENQFDFSLEYQEITKKLCLARYGTLPQLVSFPYRIYGSRTLSEDSLLTQSAIEGVLQSAKVAVEQPEVQVEPLQFSKISNPVVSKDAAGLTFLYVRQGFPDTEIHFARNGKIINSPGFNEHSWKQDGNRITLHSEDGIERVDLRAQKDEFVGHFVNSGSRTPVRLIARASSVMPNSVTLKIDNKIIRWVFAFEHDMKFQVRNVLPWALPDAERVDASVPADFTVGVYVNDLQVAQFADLPGMKFLLACEKETRHPRIHAGYSFVQDPRDTDDLSYTRYAPTLCCWSPPLSGIKCKRMSVVESGQYHWRRKMVDKAKAVVTDLEIWGGMSGKPLPGYHNFSNKAYGNDKYLGIVDSAFYLSLERGQAQDYITEKITDAIMCEAVPVYHGAPNIHEYFLPDSYIPFEQMDKVNWSQWVSEYNKRQAAVLAQKELIRTKFNVFSYFSVLTQDLSRLNQIRPITL